LRDGGGGERSAMDAHLAQRSGEMGEFAFELTVAAKLRT